jgi:hypothetical protein
MSGSIARGITSQPTKAEALAQVQALIVGTTKYYPSGSLTFGNAVHSTASLVQSFQSLEQAMNVLNTAQSAARDAASALRALDASVGPLLRDYKRFLLATYGTATQQLADFGLQPTKARTPLSTEKRATATAKARATRVARGTKGKKQKLAITGNVTGVTVTPIVASPSQPAPVTAPAPAKS